MTCKFDLKHPLVTVWAQVSGPISTYRAKMAIDTGASKTLIRPDVFKLCGYDLEFHNESNRIVTVGGLIPVIEVCLTKFRCLEIESRNFRVCCYENLSHLPFDGLLGLDFFKNTKLQIDFKKGIIELNV